MDIVELLSGWEGTIDVNDEPVGKLDGLKDALDIASLTDKPIYSIVLHPARENAMTGEFERDKQYAITVKKYMTEYATPEFDFMERMNGNVPMPLRTMIGTVERETKGMIYMKLHGDILSERTRYCMKCGRPIDNYVSQYFGMGPICGGHNYVNPFNTQDELRQAVRLYRKTVLNKIVWEGWVIKSAIIEQKEVNND